MWSLKRSQVQPIGLDIGHDSIKMLQLEVVGESASATRGLSVVAAARYALPEQARQQTGQRATLPVDAIRRLFEQQPFVGRRVVATLPRELVHVKNLRLPPIPAAEACRLHRH